MKQIKKILISGGGTGGHVFPAIAIANAIKALDPNCDILFVGAEGKLEIEKVPQAGYKIEGLPIMGFQRKLTLKNIVFFFKLIKSMIKAKRIVRDFRPHVAIGVGGYASGPVLKIAGKMGVPILIQEQNSYAGVTNRLLSKYASKICVAYEGMEKYFPSGKILLTGNPVRRNITNGCQKKEEAKNIFSLGHCEKIILVIGGSLGAYTINQSLLMGLKSIQKNKLGIIWQTGKYYFEKIYESTKDKVGDSIKIMPFIDDMNNAYAAADIIVSRAGAGTISELCLIGKPVVLIPSPNVAEDHQTKNALALVEKSAAVLIKDKDANEKLVDSLLSLSNDNEKCVQLSKNIKCMAKPHADSQIAEEALKLIN